METIVDAIPELIKEIEQLEELKTVKESERLTLESQNRKLRYRLNILRKVMKRTFSNFTFSDRYFSITVTSAYL